MLVPHDEIYQLLRYKYRGHCPNKLLDMVLAQMKASLQVDNGSDTGKTFMSKTLDATSRLNTAIAHLAWQIQDRTLFNAAICEEVCQEDDDLGMLLSPYPASELRDFLDWNTLYVHPTLLAGVVCYELLTFINIGHVHFSAIFVTPGILQRNN